MSLRAVQTVTFSPLREHTGLRREQYRASETAQSGRLALMARWYQDSERIHLALGSAEQGVVPWKSPYFSKVGVPRNFSTGKQYHGINVFLLGSLRYTSPFFLTFLQAKELV